MTKGQTLTDPYRNGSGIACEAVPPGVAAPQPDPDHPQPSEPRRLTRRSSLQSLCPPSGPVKMRWTAARLNAQIRRRLRLRPRQALAPLQTAMWAACPLH